MQVLNSTSDYLAIKEKAEMLLLNSEFNEINLENMETESLDVNSELLKSFLMKSWTEAKKNLSEWKDIQDICGDTERFEDDLESLKHMSNYNRKLMLINSELKQADDSDAVIDFMTTYIEANKNYKVLNFPNLKYKELLYVNLVEEWIDHSDRMGDDLFNLIDKHQRTVEFEESWDLLVTGKDQNTGKELSKISDEIDHLLLEWRKRMPDDKRTPLHAHRVLDQRNLFSKLFFKKFLDSISETPNIGNITVPYIEPNSNEVKPLDNQLYNNLKLAFIQRKFNNPSTFDLSFLKEERRNLYKYYTSTLYHLYKETLEQNDEENSSAILNYILAEKGSMKLSTHFKTAKLKHMIKANQLSDAYDLAAQIMNEYSTNGKLYEQVFELFYKIIQHKPKFDPATDEYHICELYNAMCKSLIYKFDKNAKKMFYKFLVVYCIYNKNNVNLEKLKSHIPYTPTMLFKLHLEEIKLFMNSDFIAEVNMVLEAEDPYFSHFANENLHNLYKDEATKLTLDTLGPKFEGNILTLEELKTTVERVTNDLNIISLIWVKNLIEHIYKTGELDQMLLRNLMSRNPQIKGPLAKFTSQNLSKQERLLQLLDYFENWIDVTFSFDKVFVKELVVKNAIYLNYTSNSKLRISNEVAKIRYQIRPFIKIIRSSHLFYLQIKVYDDAYKFKKLNIFPNLISNPVDNFVYNNINLVLDDIFFKGSNTYTILPQPQKNFGVVDNNWLMYEE